MTDDDLRHAVAAELCWDPRVDSAAIEVSARRQRGIKTPNLEEPRWRWRGFFWAVVDKHGGHHSGGRLRTAVYRAWTPRNCTALGRLA